MLTNIRIRLASRFAASVPVYCTRINTPLASRQTSINKMGKGKSKKQLREANLRGYATTSVIKERPSKTDDDELLAAAAVDAPPLLVSCTLLVERGAVRLLLSAGGASSSSAPSTPAAATPAAKRAYSAPASTPPVTPTPPTAPAEAKPPPLSRPQTIQQSAKVVEKQTGFLSARRPSRAASPSPPRCPRRASITTHPPRRHHHHPLRKRVAAAPAPTAPRRRYNCRLRPSWRRRGMTTCARRSLVWTRPSN